VDEGSTHRTLEIKYMETVQFEKLRSNSASLEKDLEWFGKILEERMRPYHGETLMYKDIFEIEPPDLSGDSSIYSRFIAHYDVKIGERLVLILALIPHIKPEVLDQFFLKNKGTDRIFTEFGGIKGTNHGGFMPTGETAAFIISGNHLTNRIYIKEIFSAQHYFRKHHIVHLEVPPPGEPYLAGQLVISEEYLSLFTTGESFKPDFSINFPATRLTTLMEWEDLVLEPQIKDEIENMLTWIKHQSALEVHGTFGKKIMPGYRALFYGPPGTGKSLSVTLLGKLTEKDVYRIDLSRVVSKYIGETEKNLSLIFDVAENKNWILFFDEADALFGQRTEMKDSKDRYANQETAYLLQRIEHYRGLVVLATNLKPNLDKAFIRRFQSMIYFGMPGKEERIILWESAIKELATAPINLEEMAEKFELSGGAIHNAVQYAMLSALREGREKLIREDLIKAIKREYAKEGKTFIS
jgi:DNA polymerase III delta prime subunit